MNNFCKICKKSFKSSLSLSKHINNYHKLSKKQYIIQYELNGKYPKCKCGCGQYTNFTRGKFSDYINGHCPMTSESLKKRFETNLKKYGYITPSKNKKVIEKSKKTSIKRYGVNNPSKSEEVKNKIKQTNLERYNVEYTWQSEEVKNKIKQTNLKRYNVENPLQSEEVKNKIKQTNIKKYGVEYPSQSIVIKEKIKLNLLKTFYDRLKCSIILNEKIIPLFTVDEYTGVKLNQRYKFQCKECNNVFYDRLDDGHIPICRSCNPVNYQKTQNKILEYIKSMYHEEILVNVRTIISPLELDIYIPEKKLAIEFNGLYWHSELNGKDKKYHLNKTIQCENKNIHLIHIFEDEWLNKQDIVKRRLKHILGKSDKVIYARKCKIKELFSEEKRIFLEQYHIQGNDKSAIKLGLFTGGELVSVMTFGKRRISLGKKLTEEGEYELMRYATSVSVIGGAGKLLSYFIKNYNPVKIISYADRRWSRGNLYEKLGFNKTGETPVNYWYFKNGYFIRNHRFNFRKNVLNEKLETFNSSLTEWENMQLAGYNRIWDCGSVKFVLKI